MNKTCTKCFKELDLSSFSPRKKSPDGLHFWCRSCVREYDRAYHARRGSQQIQRKLSLTRAWKRKRAEEFDAKFKSGPCLDCGLRFHPAAMQFDHLKDKSFNVGDKKVALSLQELEAEISKCEVVCANCHAVRTHNIKQGLR